MKKQEGNQEATSHFPTPSTAKPFLPPRDLLGATLLEAAALPTHHHRLEDLRGDGRQHALVIVLSDAGEDAGKLAGDRTEKDAQGDVDIL